MKLLATAMLGFSSIGMLHAQVVEITLGSALEDRAFDETSIGQVAIYAGPDIATGGLAIEWSFYNNDQPSPGVTPLLFERVNETDFVLRGTGAPRPVGNSGIQTFRYDAEARDPYVSSNFTFGFTDRVAYVPEVNPTREIFTASRHAGVIDFGYTNGPGWYFTSNETFELEIGQVYRLNGTTAGNVVRLQNDPNGTRSYSATMTAWGSLPRIRATISPAFEICWRSISNRHYRVEWTAGLDTGWKDFGELITGNGTTNCVFDSSRNGEQRFFRIVSLP